MKKTLLESYALLVCLISLAVVAFSTVDVLQESVKVTFPSNDLLDYVYNRYQTNDAFWAFKKATFAILNLLVQPSAKP